MSGQVFVMDRREISGAHRVLLGGRVVDVQAVEHGPDGSVAWVRDLDSGRVTREELPDQVDAIV
ncbi:hypothetical protein [Deinococcus soli (ex Cha et al. 2016)]|uniref:Uncharacterized protein n=1 Tax=Deinococcus soli (ex Cha et al. 2016) TaxID=1309411 RepID=A0AAE4BN63_9DEIO|nr:hypothetical protein [Deinococcus soli (ex Cha et al. 2016)]MDR6218809.1 hypothetical protein [Deinococcus soli (ex Cha et al. 2016)]MDR6328606.1 hypothetical protein [Deinococcus soli (ex Cha et al. 2016)]